MESSESPYIHPLSHLCLQHQEPPSGKCRLFPLISYPLVALWPERTQLSSQQCHWDEWQTPDSGTPQHTTHGKNFPERQQKHRVSYQGQQASGSWYASDNLIKLEAPSLLLTGREAALNYLAEDKGGVSKNADRKPGCNWPWGHWDVPPCIYMVPKKRPQGTPW